MRRVEWSAVLLMVCAGVTAALGIDDAAARTAATAASEEPVLRAPAPVRAQRSKKPAASGISSIQAQAERQARVSGVRSWGYQLAGMSIEEAARSPYDLLVVDATAGLASGKPFTAAQVEQLKRKPDGSRRLVVSYLSVGEAEDYRPDYFTPEYMTEDAPDWLLHENKDWKGNRLIAFCQEGWQLTILGDENGRNVYNSIDPSPLYRLIELGFDGIYLDRVDVYEEVAKQCDRAEDRMADFVARLAAHARLKNPTFLVIQQNAEGLLAHRKVVDAIDAVGKEDLFFGIGHTQKKNSDGAIRSSLRQLLAVKAAGKPVFVIDYLTDRGRREEARRLIEEQGFIPYIGPRNLGELWLPGKHF
jgi:cysteinyl-tRNA synthetase, unknown class